MCGILVWLCAEWTYVPLLNGSSARSLGSKRLSYPQSSADLRFQCDSEQHELHREALASAQTCGLCHRCPTCCMSLICSSIGAGSDTFNTVCKTVSMQSRLTRSWSLSFSPAYDLLPTPLLIEKPQSSSYYIRAKYIAFTK